MSRRSLLVAVLFLATSLAGCADDSPSGSGDGDGMDSTGPSSTDAQRFQSRENVTVGPVPDMVPVGPGLSNGNCVTLHPDAPFRIVGGNVTLTWNATTDLSETMDIIMVARQGDLVVKAGQGPSPRVLSLEAFDAGTDPVHFQAKMHGRTSAYPMEAATFDLDIHYISASTPDATNGGCYFS